MALPLPPVRVMLAEEDEKITQDIIAELHKQGCQVISTGKRGKFSQLMQQWLPEVILFNVQLAIREGWDAVNKSAAIPAIALVSLESLSDGAATIPLWADDFMLLPLNARELMARLHLMAGKRQQTQDNWLSSQHLRVNPQTRQVLVGTEQQDIGRQLTRTELKILMLLLREPTQIFSRQEIRDACISDSDADERTVDSHISKLRRKMTAAGLRFVPESIRGRGYRLGD